VTFIKLIKAFGFSFVHGILLFKKSPRLGNYRSIHLFGVLFRRIAASSNNDAELGARVEKRRQDVSLHTISDAGTTAKDAFLTITQTAKKLGVNAFNYINDRVSGKFNMPALSDLLIENDMPQAWVALLSAKSS
jgi:hypothetical protein